MGWVVTSWRTEALEAAGREARRISRSAARELADARAYLDALERFGLDTRADIRRQRVALRADGGAAPVTVRPAAQAAATRRRRPQRASLRESPLAELFRATADG